MQTIRDLKGLKSKHVTHLCTRAGLLICRLLRSCVAKQQIYNKVDTQLKNTMRIMSGKIPVVTYPKSHISS